MAKAATAALLSPHMRRYLLFRGGKTYEEIAALEGVKVDTVERSIAMAQGERSLLTVPEMQVGQIEVVQAVRELEKNALAEALTAQVTEQVGVDKHGQPIMQTRADHDIRLKAIDRVNAKVEAVTPKKGGGIGIFVGQQTKGDEPPPMPIPTARGRRFEDILRNIKQQRQLPAETETLEAEHEPAPTS